MEKIIFFGLVIPILGFVLYLGATAIMKGFSAKNENKSEKNIENEVTEEFSLDENKLSDEPYQDRSITLAPYDCRRSQK